MIKAIIIDDEPYCCEVLSTLLEKYCPTVTVEAVCHSAAEAMQAITNHPVQLVFLDIEMPHMNGFQLLEKLPHINFDLIFTTSYDQYALKAIKFSALDYLLKPIDRIELQAAVRKAHDRLMRPLPQQLQILLQKLHQPAQQVNQVALPTMEGLQLVPLDSIISCSSSSNYTIISLKDKLKITVSRTLKEVEEMLEESGFMRVHHSYLVNLNEIRKYIKGEGGNLIMSDRSSIDVSRSKKELLLKKLQPGKNQFTTK
ncbi:LytTR family DNA-binding domain-containing protein [Paraflavitalea sp. CAU 1676]|uniref:LytR/AlgR family response regulator transcription factor n=1 Tax=Paraflavitalea sp. CAU 1676 TaxID=3032598 RepID=UPI0023DB5E69|nr:LytTR family DNA-binding domain-containing protein [Paraflavitalea sp. CAU 1676]MDF2193582.1 LytTR family DNA-binding domain-containing protein [Paraflavitalea sp. CAU 1676]